MLKQLLLGASVYATAVGTGLLPPLNLGGNATPTPGGNDGGGDGIGSNSDTANIEALAAAMSELEGIQSDLYAAEQARANALATNDGVAYDSAEAEIASLEASKAATLSEITTLQNLVGTSELSSAYLTLLQSTQSLQTTNASLLAALQDPWSQGVSLPFEGTISEWTLDGSGRLSRPGFASRAVSIGGQLAPGDCFLPSLELSGTSWSLTCADYSNLNRVVLRVDDGAKFISGAFQIGTAPYYTTTRCIGVIDGETGGWGCSDCVNVTTSTAYGSGSCNNSGYNYFNSVYAGSNPITSPINKTVIRADLVEYVFSQAPTGPITINASAPATVYDAVAYT